jgi:hypothetical protein
MSRPRNSSGESTAIHLEDGRYLWRGDRGERRNGGSGAVRYGERGEEFGERREGRNVAGGERDGMGSMNG